MRKVKVTLNNGRESEYEPRLAKFLVDKGRAEYVNEEEKPVRVATKQMVAEDAEQEAPKKRGRPKKNTYETKDLVSE